MIVKGGNGGPLIMLKVLSSLALPSLVLASLARAEGVPIVCTANKSATCSPSGGCVPDNTALYSRVLSLNAETRRAKIVSTGFVGTGDLGNVYGVDERPDGTDLTIVDIGSDRQVFSGVQKLRETAENVITMVGRNGSVSFVMLTVGANSYIETRMSSTAFGIEPHHYVQMGTCKGADKILNARDKGLE